MLVATRPVYPRVGGANPITSQQGLTARIMRSIPAWAGQTPCRRLIRQEGCVARVYPRVGGGADRCPEVHASGIGLSPRGRGSLAGPACHRRPDGSIPAWAGEPGRREVHPPSPEVYPRVGGGAERQPAESVCLSGLSPRGRGRPAPRRTARPPRKVYPRVGGGAMLMRTKEHCV